MFLFWQDALDEYNRLKDIKKVLEFIINLKLFTQACVFCFVFVFFKRSTLYLLMSYSFMNVPPSSPKTPDYRMKKRRCKYLKSKLNHIKKMVSDYDRRAWAAPRGF